ncbi:zinc finger domain-containing protein [Mycobacterium intracellulare]
MIYISRTEARTMQCPYCRAPVGTKCRGKRGERESNHRERVQAFMELVK